MVIAAIVNMFYDTMHVVQSRPSVCTVSVSSPIAELL